MLLSLVPFYFLVAFAVNTFRNRQISVFLISFILFAYLGGVMMPAFRKEGCFAYHVPHNWRSAIATLNKNLRKGDVIILRSGFVKENWIPSTEQKIIREYVKAPLRSFYFHPDCMRRDKNSKKTDFQNIQIYNMTYTREIDFYPYYNKIFDDCDMRRWVWIIGVNPPNTNYSISQVPEILRNSHKKYFEKDFNGVYLVLLKQREIIYKRFNPLDP
jgi:hypothetical protein